MGCEYMSALSLDQIRESERKSHVEAYTDNRLYGDSSWLKKPVKTLMDLFPYFQNRQQLHVLDLGCGVGRNCIAVAQHFQSISCRIDCIDILDLAINKLNENAEEFGVSQSIHGIVQPIEAFPIQQNHYDWIIAVSALEHVDSQDSFICKLAQIRDGIRNNGIVCMVINTNVRESDKSTGVPLPAQFEVNLPTEKLQNLLYQFFADWEIIKSTVREQRYDIPRENGISDLRTSVVTFVAKK